jgi:hypothetical protein
MSPALLELREDKKSHFCLIISKKKAYGKKCIWHKICFTFFCIFCSHKHSTRCTPGARTNARMLSYKSHSFIHFPLGFQLEHRAPFGVFMIIHTNSSGRVISPSQRPLPTQDNTTYRHKRQTSKPRAGFEPTIPTTKLPQTYALDRAALGSASYKSSPPVIVVRL